MKRAMFIILFLMSCWFLMPSIVTAVTVDYKAIGTINDVHGNTLEITGMAYIDDQLRKFGGEPVDPDGIIKNEAYVYWFTFGLNVGDYAFYGDGEILFYIWDIYETGDLEIGHNSMTFYGHHGSQWDYWYGEFYGIDSYVPLGNVINPKLHAWDHDCLILGNFIEHWPALDLTFARRVYTQVPEPSLTIFLGAGLIGGLAYKKFRRRERKSN